MIFMGAPLEVEGIRYTDKLDRELDQEDYVFEFQDNVRDYLEDRDDDEVEYYSTSLVLLWGSFNSLVQTDMFFAFGSVTFVFGYVSWHIRSVFLGAAAMMIILFSFPITMVIYDYIFQVKYLSTLNQLVIFIVLGIAADDIFVFVDAWRQSFSYKDHLHNDIERMSYTWRRATRAMAVTSSTTAVAFLANAFSSIMPISAFGIYAAIIIPVNYFLVISFFPAVLMFWEQKIKGKMCVCRRKKKAGNG